jgi:hypothetical protein
MRTNAIAVVALLLPSLVMAAADVGQTRPAGQRGFTALTPGAVVAGPPAIETLRGVVAGVDEGNDLIEIRLSPDTTEQFKVQDGLIFDAVRYGDPVDVSIQNIGGARTIVGLSKE